MSTTNNISIVIPSYNREQVLLDTITSLLDISGAVKPEILVIDQSETHLPQTKAVLSEWQTAGTIRLIQMPEPSIPKAMNTGLKKASHPIVLFVDDDIKAHPALLSEHLETQSRGNENLIVAGKVIQPWDKLQKLADDGHQFNSDKTKYIKHFMGGNFSINRSRALALGGFDENFIDVAYRFEKEFADRWLNAGNKILFNPDAAIDHLKVHSGGTRQFGEHLTTYKPHHAVGAYYYFLISARVTNKWAEIFKRLVNSCYTRHHLKKPWYIPLTLVAECSGLFKAIKLKRAGASYVNVDKEIS